MNWYKRANMLSATIYAILSRLENGAINTFDTESISGQIPIGTSLVDIQQAIEGALRSLGKNATDLNEAQRGVVDQILSQYGDFQNQDMGNGDPIEPIGQPQLEHA